jgi:hypothetical protein
MTALVLLLGTIGAWLLFAGPIYQAALEMRGHDDASERIRGAVSSVVPPPPVSWWWWLIPPAKIGLEWRRATRHRRAHMDALSVEDFESLLGFIHKATGWTLVGTGGLFMAIAQSYTFAQQYPIGDAAFVAMVTLVATACVVGCTLRFRGGDRLLEDKKRASRDAR